jgi:hypothetical protein
MKNILKDIERRYYQNKLVNGSIIELYRLYQNIFRTSLINMENYERYLHEETYEDESPGDWLFDTLCQTKEGFIQMHEDYIQTLKVTSCDKKKKIRVKYLIPTYSRMINLQSRLGANVKNAMSFVFDDTDKTKFARLYTETIKILYRSIYIVNKLTIGYLFRSIGGNKIRDIVLSEISLLEIETILDKKRY